MTPCWAVWSGRVADDIVGVRPSRQSPSDGKARGYKTPPASIEEASIRAKCASMARPILVARVLSRRSVPASCTRPTETKLRGHGGTTSSAQNGGWLRSAACRECRGLSMQARYGAAIGRGFILPSLGLQSTDRRSLSYRWAKGPPRECRQDMQMGR